MRRHITKVQKGQLTNKEAGMICAAASARFELSRTLYARPAGPLEFNANPRGQIDQQNPHLTAENNCTSKRHFLVTTPTRNIVAA